MKKGDKQIRHLMYCIYNIKILNINTNKSKCIVVYHRYDIEKNKSAESCIRFYNKYNQLICSTKLKYIYIKNNQINIYR